MAVLGDCFSGFESSLSCLLNSALYLTLWAVCFITSMGLTFTFTRLKCEYAKQVSLAAATLLFPPGLMAVYQSYRGKPIAGNGTRIPDLFFTDPDEAFRWGIHPWLFDRDRDKVPAQGPETQTWTQAPNTSKVPNFFSSF